MGRGPVKDAAYESKAWYRDTTFFPHPRGEQGAPLFARPVGVTEMPTPLAGPKLAGRDRYKVGLGIRMVEGNGKVFGVK
jgi:hypothetical protein